MSAPTDREKAPAPPKRPEPDERLIDSPSRPTLVILGAICLATLVMWGAGRAACNYHVPGESLTPRAVSLDERTQNPKDLALEFAQALAGGDFATARQLAHGSALETVEQAARACPGACASKAAVRPELATLADLLKYNPVDSYVKTKSLTPRGVVSQHLLEVERIEQGYKVTRVLPEGAAMAELKQAPAPLAVPSRGDPSVPPSLRAP